MLPPFLSDNFTTVDMGSDGIYLYSDPLSESEIKDHKPNYIIRPESYHEFILELLERMSPNVFK